MTGILLAVGVQKVERDFVDVPLQAQQRREMGLAGDAAAEAQQFVERTAEQVVGAPAEPVAERAVDLHDARRRATARHSRTAQFS